MMMPRPLSLPGSPPQGKRRRYPEPWPLRSPRLQKLSQPCKLPRLTVPHQGNGPMMI